MILVHSTFRAADTAGIKAGLPLAAGPRSIRQCPPDQARGPSRLRVGAP